MDLTTLLAITAKTLLGLLVIPVLIALYYDKGSKATGQLFQRWILKNGYFYPLVLLVGLGVFVEIQVSPHTHASDDKALEFLSLPAYESELNQHSELSSLPNWPSERQQLLRKFELAQYAWNAKDYEAAVRALTALEIGQDQVGALQRIPSYVVFNDLGCILFKEQRNRDFKSFVYFQSAKGLVGPNDQYKSIIEENIRRLDKMANTLD